MRLVRVLLIPGLGVLLSGTPLDQGNAGAAGASYVVSSVSKEEVPWEIARLAYAYPRFIDYVDSEFILWKDGTRLSWKEGGQRLVSLFQTPPSYEELLKEHPTRVFREEAISDWFDSYAPGRILYLNIFKKMYGANPDAVWHKLRVVRFMPRTLNLKLRFSTVNGAADALEAVGRELDKLPASLRPYLQRCTTYVDRSVAGTQIRSLHSFGIAIDINPRYGNYWRWDWEQSDTDTFVPRNRIPRQIVEIFEKHGFLWGGRWYLYDTLHFEYRPELFLNQDAP